jgi:hypothetical protein
MEDIGDITYERGGKVRIPFSVMEEQCRRREWGMIRQSGSKKGIIQFFSVAIWVDA